MSLLHFVAWQVRGSVNFKINKIEGTPILKLAIGKKLKVKKNLSIKFFIPQNSSFTKIRHSTREFSSLFQYSDKSVACTETKDTSAESLGSQLFGARRT